MTDSHARLDLAAYRAATTLVAINLGVTWANLPRRGHLYPRGFGVAAAAALTLLVGWCAWQARRSPLVTRSGLQALALVSGVLVWVQVLLVPVTLGSGDYPPLLHAAGAATVMSVVAFGPRTASVMVLGYGAGFLLLRQRSLGGLYAGAETLVFIISGLAACLFYWLARRVVTVVSGHARIAHAEATRTARAEARVAERAAGDGLIHDKVLGALALAAHGEPAAAARLAQDAMDSFARQEPPPSTDPVSVLLRQQGDALGLDLDLEIHGTGLPAQLRQMVMSVAFEVLTNVRKHSGTRSAQVRGALDVHGGHLSVTDHGRGYVPGEHHGRAGLRTATSRMRSLGGDLKVAAAPGGGTIVTLTWQQQPGDLDTLGWDAGLFLPMVGLGVLDVGLNIVMGLHRGVPPLLPAVQATVIVAVIFISAAVVTPCGSSKPTLVATAAGCLVLPAVVSLNSSHPGPADWRYWAVGALTPAVGVLAFRLYWRLGLTVAAVMLALVVLAEAIRGTASTAPVTGPFPVLFAVVAVGGVMRSGLDRATASIATAAARRASQDQLQLKLHEHEAEMVRRRAGLKDEVMPMLRRIATGQQLSPADTAECSLLEASTRDGLVAPGLNTQPVSAAATQARRRDVTVTLVDLAPEGPTIGGQPFEAALRQCLRLLPPGTSLRATRTTGGVRSGGTIVAVGPGCCTAVTAALTELTSGAGPPASVTCLEDSVMVQLDPPLDPATDRPD